MSNVSRILKVRRGGKEKGTDTLMSGMSVGCVLTKAPVQSDKQLTGAESDGGVSRDDDGLVSTFRVPAVVDLKLQHSRDSVTQL